MDDKDFKRLLTAMIIIEVMWVVIIAAGCFAVLDTIRSYAAEPSIIMNGVYVDSQENAIEINEAPPINRVSEALDDIDSQPELEYLGTFFETMYCSGRCCNGKNAGIDGFGNPLEWGCVAVDPRVIPLHTKIVIEGYEGMIFEARDTGSGVDGRHIDIFWPGTHKEALARCNDRWLKVWRVK